MQGDKWLVFPKESIIFDFKTKTVPPSALQCPGGHASKFFIPTTDDGEEEIQPTIGRVRGRMFLAEGRKL